MTTNLFAGIPDDFREELLTPLLNAPPVRIERIVSKGRRLLVRTAHARMGGLPGWSSRIASWRWGPETRLTSQHAEWLGRRQMSRRSGWRCFTTRGEGGLLGRGGGCAVCLAAWPPDRNAGWVTAARRP